MTCFLFPCVVPPSHTGNILHVYILKDKNKSEGQAWKVSLVKPVVYLSKNYNDYYLSLRHHFINRLIKENLNKFLIEIETELQNKTKSPVFYLTPFHRKYIEFILGDLQLVQEIGLGSLLKRYYPDKFEKNICIDIEKSEKKINPFDEEIKMIESSQMLLYKGLDKKLKLSKLKQVLFDTCCLKNVFPQINQEIILNFIQLVASQDKVDLRDKTYDTVKSHIDKEYQSINFFPDPNMIEKKKMKILQDCYIFANDDADDKTFIRLLVDDMINANNATYQIMDNIMLRLQQSTKEHSQHSL